MPAISFKTLPSSSACWILNLNPISPHCSTDSRLFPKIFQILKSRHETQETPGNQKEKENNDNGYAGK